MTNAHESIILDYIKKNPSWKRFQLRNELNKVFKDDYFEPLYYIPDAYEINTKTNTLNLLEVDGTSGTSERKLSNIVSLWWEIDGRSWFLTLTSISVHTKAVSFLDDSKLTELALRYDKERCYEYHR